MPDVCPASFCPRRSRMATSALWGTPAISRRGKLLAAGNGFGLRNWLCLLPELL